MQTTVATAELRSVRNTEPNCSTEVQAAPLNPYQPSHRINTPRHPIGRLCPGMHLLLRSYHSYPYRTYRYGVLTVLHRSERKYHLPCGSHRILRNHGSQAVPASRRPRSSELRWDRSMRRSHRSKYNRIRTWFFCHSTGYDGSCGSTEHQVKYEI